MRLAILATILALPAAAETVLSPSEFETISKGKTLYFTQNGKPYGAEQFFTDKRSLWMYSDGTCTDGTWFANGPLICFDYTKEADLQCWSVVDKDGQLAARPEGGSLRDDIDLSHTTEKPLSCPGPAVGV